LGPQVAALAAILLAVGRRGTVERLYTASRLPRVAAAWDAATAPHAPGEGDAGGAPEGPHKAAAGPEGLGGGVLGAGYGAVLSLLEGEAAWLGGCLPELRGPLLGGLALAALTKVGVLSHAWAAARWKGSHSLWRQPGCVSSRTTHLRTHPHPTLEHLAHPPPHPQVNKPLRERLAPLSNTPLLQALLADALGFARGLAAALGAAGVEAGAVNDVVRTALEPVEEQVRAGGGWCKEDAAGAGGLLVLRPSEGKPHRGVPTLLGPSFPPAAAGPSPHRPPSP
jgi:hypothetical protein